MDKDIHIKYKTEEGKEKNSKEYNTIEGKQQRMSDKKAGNSADDQCTANTKTVQKNHDYDDVFKSMKRNDTRLFIPVINEHFGRSYTENDELEVLVSEGDLTKLADGKADIHSRTSDFLIRIRDELYLIECQSYQDGSMAIRIAEYAFISAKQNAIWEKDRVILKMPNYCIVYVKNDNSTPEYTKITYEFPDGRLVEYDSKNILIANYSKEEILQKRLYTYVPYSILRYEKQLKENKIPIEFVKEELEYLLEGMKAAVARNELEVFDYYNIRAFTNTVIGHFLHGEKKERLVNVMGGSIITTEADEILQHGIEQGMERGMEQGRSVQREEDLKSLVLTLKKLTNRLEEVYQLVIENENYADVTLEQVKKYYQSE